MVPALTSTFSHEAWEKPEQQFNDDSFTENGTAGTILPSSYRFVWKLRSSKRYMYVDANINIQNPLGGAQDSTEIVATEIPSKVTSNSKLSQSLDLLYPW